MGIKFDQASQSVTEGDVVAILITADHIAVENISIILQLTPLTASGTYVYQEYIASTYVNTYHYFRK